MKPWGPAATLAWFGLFAVGTLILKDVLTIIGLYYAVSLRPDLDPAGEMLRRVLTQSEPQALEAFINRHRLALAQAVYHDAPYVFFGNLVGAALLIPGLCAAAFLRRTLPVREYLALHGLPPGALARWVGAAVSAEVLLSTLRWAAGDPTLAAQRLASTQALVIPAGAFAFGATVLHSAEREVLFRGFLFRGLGETRFGPAGAVALVTLLYAAWTAFDGGWAARWEIARDLLLGGLFALARLRTGSLAAPAAMHVASHLVVDHWPA